MECCVKARVDRVLSLTGGKPFITSSQEDLFYFAGFTGDYGFMVLSPSNLCLVTTRMFEGEAREVVQPFEVYITEKEKVFSKVAEVLVHIGAGEVFVSSSEKLVDFISFLGVIGDIGKVSSEKRTLVLEKRSLVVDGFKVHFGEYLTHRVRMVKDEVEIKKMKDNVILSDEGFLYLLRLLRPGVSELELSAELEYYLKFKGAENMSFPTIIASGVRSSFPHAKTSSRTLLSDEPVVIDFGIKRGGYCTDTTRTVFLGNPPQKFKYVYSVVLEALNEGISFAREGVTAEELDGRVRRSIARYGLEEYFVHSTGHSIGLETHEFPFIRKGVAQELMEGMVITIEPGVYIPGEFGVRIENMILIKKSSCEVLTTLGTELLVL